MAANNIDDPLDKEKELAMAKEGGGGNPLEQIERLLTCPICLDRYKQPKLLACQHTFCLVCLESYVESTGGRPRLRCPECRAEHGLSLDGGVQSLQTNLTLLSFLEIHMEASAANAAEMQAYVQRFNLERCRVCEEKAELELCSHCERKCCAECRTSHADMLKRDLGRLLGQVKRLSSRVKEASNGMGRGMEQLLANGEQTRQEIRDYFNRYQRELKKREENFLEQADVFMQNEERLMRTLRDALDVEWNNLQDACIWVDAALSGQRQARDEDLARFKLEFQQGLDYLRSFQPDSEELFAKKLRFSPGDDAAKLPTAIANFGELTVSLPQFANRYLPLEQQYLPRPFRMSLESDNFMRRDRLDKNRLGGALRGGGEEESTGQESAGAQRWRRRRELEEEAWTRLRAEGSLRVEMPASGFRSPGSYSQATSGAVSPLPFEPRSPAKSPAPAALSPAPIPAPVIPAATGGGPKKQAGNEVKKMEEAGGGGKEDEQIEEPKAREEPGEKAKAVEASHPEEPASEPATRQATAPPNPPSPAIPKPATTAQTTPATVTKPMGSQQAAAAAARPPSGLPQAKGKSTTPSGIPTSSQQQSGNGPKNAQAEGQPATRGRLLMVNGPRAGSAGGATAAGAPRRTGPQHPPHPHNLHQLHQQNQLELHAKGQKPPLPVRQSSATPSDEKQRRGSRRSTPQKAASPKGKNGKEGGGKEEEEEEEEEARPEEADGQRARQKQQQIQSQSKRFNIQCRSSSHGRPKRRPSIETGQPIPVAFFPAKSTGEWPEQLGPMLLSRSRTNPDLAAELALAQSPVLARRRPSREEPKEAQNRPDARPGMDYEGMRPRPRLVLGGRGTSLGQMNWPRGICALPDDQNEGDVFAVADSSNHRVQIFSAHEGSLLRSFGSFGTADGQFDGCCAVCVHKSRGELLVADRYNHRVQIFDLRGRFVRKFGCRGTGPGEFQHCWGIAVDEQLGLVYVADKDNHRVQMFDAEGAFLTQFGSMGDGARQFNHPLYLAFYSPTRLLYVSDSANNRICVYSPDGSPLRQFQGQGPPESQLKLPRGIALDEKGCLIIADSGNNRMLILSPEGQCIRQFGAWGAAPGQFKGVEGLCMLGGQLAVADRENNRVQLFACSSNATNNASSS